MMMTFAGMHHYDAHAHGCSSHSTSICTKHYFLAKTSPLEQNTASTETNELCNNNKNMLSYSSSKSKVDICWRKEYTKERALNTGKKKCVSIQAL